jgi:hypothetical protein
MEVSAAAPDAADGVVMSRVLGQDAPDMPLTIDQQVVEALAAQHARIPFGE